MSKACATGRGFPRSLRHLAWIGTAALTASCAGGPGANGAGGAAGRGDIASEAEWRALATERPSPLPGASRITVGDFELLGEPPVPVRSPVPLTIGMSELVAAGLLRRRDVLYVERRRFEAAVAAERSGVRPPGAPRAGVSPGAELLATIVQVPLSATEASLEVRLADTSTGAVVGARRQTVPVDADLVGLSRTAVATILQVLRELDRLPAWTDPLPTAAPAQYVPSGTSEAALAAFFEGLGAEEAWSWEAARRAYQAAAARVEFFEAAVAMARTARLRIGGTLGES